MCLARKKAVSKYLRQGRFKLIPGCTFLTLTIGTIPSDKLVSGLKHAHTSRSDFRHHSKRQAGFRPKACTERDLCVRGHAPSDHTPLNACNRKTIARTFNPKLKEKAAKNNCFFYSVMANLPSFTYVVENLKLQSFKARMFQPKSKQDPALQI
eukprot:704758-Pelagomonas_calceolata.AAC.2